MAALVLRGAAPYAELLVGGKGKLEAGNTGWASSAYRLGGLDLLDGLSGAAYRKEKAGIGILAGSLVSPTAIELGTHCQPHVGLSLASKIGPDSSPVQRSTADNGPIGVVCQGMAPTPVVQKHP
jgi:hypothetical protein